MQNKADLYNVTPLFQVWFKTLVPYILPLKLGALIVFFQIKQILASVGIELQYFSVTMFYISTDECLGCNDSFVMHINILYGLIEMGIFTCFI